MPIRASTTNCQYAERIYEFRFVWENKTFSISVSIGLVVLNADTQSLASVLSAAYAACYAAKTKGGIACMCTNLMIANWRSNVEKCNGYHELQKRWKRITSACIPNGLCQLKRKVNIVKSFCAWRRKPAKSSPMAFIPAAERYQLMHLIDRWVISTLLPIWGSNTRIGTAGCRIGPVSMLSTSLALVLMNSLLILCRSNLLSAVSHQSSALKLLKPLLLLR